MSKYYVLGADARTPVPVSMIEWADARSSGKKKRTPQAGDGWARVGLDKLYGWRVSTVFLGLDHSFDGGRPVLFETMVFHDDANAPMVEELNDWQKRYHTWIEAEAGHGAALALVREKAAP